jgi:hypothetical protein
MDTLQQALPAINYRISRLEQQVAAKAGNDMEAKLTQLERAMANLRAEIMAGKAAFSKSVKSKQQSAIAGLMDERDIFAPKELLIKRNKSRAGGGNRSIEITAKRWALWKVQREQGFSYQAIARAWFCNHHSIRHAEEHDWNPYLKYRGGK